MSPWKSPLLLAASALIALACGGSIEIGDVEEISFDNEDGVEEILTAGVHFGTELCTQKSGSNCENAATTFPADAPVIYYVHQTKEMPKAGDTFDFQWVAVDVGDAAPAGTIIDTVQAKVDSGDLMLKVGTHYTFSSELSKPTAGWPVGSYTVVVLKNGNTDTPYDVAPFTIQ